MLGIPDFSVALAYILLIISTIVCAVYGFINWNKGDEVDNDELEHKKTWMKEKLEIDSKVSGEELK